MPAREQQISESDPARRIFSCGWGRCGGRERFGLLGDERELPLQQPCVQVVPGHAPQNYAGVFAAAALQISQQEVERGTPLSLTQ